MQSISLGGRTVAGFALDRPIGVGEGYVSSSYAALMTGATAALAAYVLRASPLWVVLAGAGTTIGTKMLVDRSIA